MPRPSAEIREDPARLPPSVALRIAVQGIRARLGRSVATVLGVVLGTAFLMSVVAGGLIKASIARDTAIEERVERRLTLLRGEIGELDGKRIAVRGQPASEDGRRFVAALEGTVAVAIAEAGARPDADADAIVLFEGAAADALPIGSLDSAGSPGPPAFAFDDAAAAAFAPGRVEVLPFALRPEEIERAQEKRRQAQLRVYWVVGASLMITVIGIGNAMLMSVTERFREIGTLKCLGATSGFVILLFLFESAIVGLVGAAAGVVAGLCFSLAGYGYLRGLFTILGSLNPQEVLLASLACGLTGWVLTVLAGIYPARVAARMIPAAALASNV